MYAGLCVHTVDLTKGFFKWDPLVDVLIPELFEFPQSD
jgi:hypothetical protein